MIAIIDYGVGNLFSLKSSFLFIDKEAVVTSNPEEIAKSDRIILPGVGAYGDAAQKLKNSGLHEVVKKEAEKGKPILGICLGMQLLFEKSYEYGEHEGLGLIKGNIKPIADVIPKDYKIPHIGWNGLIFPENRDKSALYKYVNEGDCVYFVHSYYACDCEDSITAVSEYGGIITASVEQKNIYGTQFHPEKSGKVGLNILNAFCEL